ncbi:MAG: hypothetical protein AAF547_04975 [Actinomycetota bacterium]
MSATRRPHPALAARILTAGLSTATAFAIIALLARESQRAPQQDERPRLIEVRIGDGLDDDEARNALRAWLDGRQDLTTAGDLTVVDLPPDIESEPS